MPTFSRSSPYSRYSVSHEHKFMAFFRNRTTLRATSVRPTTHSVSDSIVAFTPAPTPRSHWSLSHTHKFMGFFCNRTSLRTSSASPTTHSVSDSIVSFTSVPTPRSHWSLSHVHKFMGFFRNRTTLRVASASPTTYSVSDIILYSHWYPPHAHTPRYHLHTEYTPATRLTIFPTRTTQYIRGV